MPLRRKIETLRALSMQAVKEYTSSYSMQEIHSIPSNLVEELIEFPRNNEGYLTISPTNRNAMITENTRKLYICFQFYDAQLTKDTFNTIFNKCKNLTRFTCMGVGNATPQDFLQVVPSLPNLVVLDTGFLPTFINDDILEALGDNCPKLESLIISQNEITDEGLRRLCLSKSGGSKIKRFTLVCNDKITGDGCLFALCIWKQLKVFECDRLFDAFKKLFLQWNGSILTTFQLCELPPIPMTDIPLGLLHFVTKCCPEVSSLQLLTSKNFNNDIDVLKLCDRNLSFSMTSRLLSTISDFSDVGSQLTTLAVINGTVDLELIGIGCPNLTKLRLVNVYYQPYNFLVRRSCHVPYRKLETLFLTGSRSTEIPIPQLIFILAACLDLKEVKINKHKTLFDDVLLAVLRLNPLKCVTSFCIAYCMRLSKACIMELLRMENVLQSVVVNTCKAITEDDCREIKSYVTLNNFSVSTHFVNNCNVLEL